MAWQASRHECRGNEPLVLADNNLVLVLLNGLINSPVVGRSKIMRNSWILMGRTVRMRLHVVLSSEPAATMDLWQSKTRRHGVQILVHFEVPARFITVTFWTSTKISPRVYRSLEIYIKQFYFLRRWEKISTHSECGLSLQESIRWIA